MHARDTFFAHAHQPLPPRKIPNDLKIEFAAGSRASRGTNGRTVYNALPRRSRQHTRTHTHTHTHTYALSLSLSLSLSLTHTHTHTHSHTHTPRAVCSALPRDPGSGRLASATAAPPPICSKRLQRRLVPALGLARAWGAAKLTGKHGERYGNMWIVADACSNRSNELGSDDRPPIGGEEAGAAPRSLPPTERPLPRPIPTQTESLRPRGVGVQELGVRGSGFRIQGLGARV